MIERGACAYGVVVIVVSLQEFLEANDAQKEYGGLIMDCTSPDGRVFWVCRHHVNLPERTPNEPRTNVPRLQVKKENSRKPYRVLVR